MNARSAARELALLTLFQLDKQGGGLTDLQNAEKQSLSDLVLNSVRALTGEAEFQIKTAADDLAAVSRMLIEYELDHPTNAESPMEAEIKPVPIPTTREMIEKIEQCLQGAEFLFEALRVPEMVTLAKEQAVRDYAVQLISLIQAHEPELDELLNQHMQDWRIDRLVRMDRYILRLAAAEMRYTPSVDLGVSINEAVELAKQYSSEESYRLINGILGALAESLEQSSPAR